MNSLRNALIGVAPGLLGAVHVLSFWLLFQNAHQSSKSPVPDQVHRTQIWAIQSMTVFSTPTRSPSALSHPLFGWEASPTKIDKPEKTYRVPTYSTLKLLEDPAQRKSPFG